MYNEDQQFDLHLEDVTRKSIRNIYSLVASTVPSLATFQQSSKNIEWTSLGLHTINRLTDRQMQSIMPPFLKEYELHTCTFK